MAKDKPEPATARFPFTLTLATPVMVGGEEKTSITLRKPKARDWRTWSARTEEAERVNGLIAALSDWPPAAIDELDFDDHVKLVEVARDFFDEYRSPMELLGTGFGQQLLNSPSFMAGLTESVKTSK